MTTSAPTECVVCGGHCADGYEMRTFTDPDTGHSQEDAWCVYCIGDEKLDRDESYCADCNERLRGDEAELCYACQEEERIEYARDMAADQRMDLEAEGE